MNAPDTLTALRAILPYAENEAYSLQSLKDSEIAEAEAEAAWKAVENARAAIETGDDLLDLLCLALPYIEEAEHDPCNKPEAVRALTRKIRAAVERAS